MANAVVVVGKRGSGKTTLSKSMIESYLKKHSNVCIYDINQEYTNYYPEPFLNFKDFLSKITKLKNHYILIEEATIFFRTRSDFEEMINVLVRSRHTGNIIHLNFHSFKSIPKNIFSLVDHIVIFKTNDTERDVKDKFDFPDILNAYKTVNSSGDKYIFRTVKL